MAFVSAFGALAADNGTTCGQEGRKFLDGTLKTLVTAAMKEVVLQQPADPLAFIARYLKANNPKRQVTEDAPLQNKIAVAIPNPEAATHAAQVKSLTNKIRRKNKMLSKIGNKADQVDPEVAICEQLPPAPPAAVELDMHKLTTHATGSRCPSVNAKDEAYPITGLANPTERDVKKTLEDLKAQGKRQVKVIWTSTTSVAEGPTRDLLFLNGCPYVTDLSKVPEPKPIQSAASPNATTNGSDLHRLNKPDLSDTTPPFDPFGALSAVLPNTLVPTLPTDVIRGLQSVAAVSTAELPLDPLHKGLDLGAFNKIDNLIGVKDDSPGSLNHVLVIVWGGHGYNDILTSTMLAVATAQTPFIHRKKYQEKAELEMERTRSLKNQFIATHYCRDIRERRERRDRQRELNEEQTLKVRKNKLNQALIAEQQAALEEKNAEKAGKKLEPAPPGSSAAAPTISSAEIQAQFNVKQQEQDELKRAQLVSRQARRRLEDVTAKNITDKEQYDAATKIQAAAKGRRVRAQNAMTTIFEATSGPSIALKTATLGLSDSEGGAPGTPPTPAIALDRTKAGSAAADSPNTGLTKVGSGTQLHGGSKKGSKGSGANKEFYSGFSLTRRTLYNLCEQHECLTTKPPTKPQEPKRRQVWLPKRVRVPPAYDDDVSSEEEVWASHDELIVRKPPTEKPLAFNPSHLIEKCAIEVCPGGKEWLSFPTKASEQFQGVSVVQKKAYTHVYAHSFHLLHASFVELKHRDQLNQVPNFEAFVQNHHFEVLNWSSHLHSFSLGIAPKGPPTSMTYGPIDVLQDRMLVASSISTTSTAPLDPGVTPPANGPETVTATTHVPWSWKPVAPGVDAPAKFLNSAAPQGKHPSAPALLGTPPPDELDRGALRSGGRAQRTVSGRNVASARPTPDSTPSNTGLKKLASNVMTQQRAVAGMTPPGQSLDPKLYPPSQASEKLGSEIVQPHRKWPIYIASDSMESEQWKKTLVGLADGANGHKRVAWISKQLAPTVYVAGRAYQAPRRPEKMEFDSDSGVRAYNDFKSANIIQSKVQERRTSTSNAPGLSVSNKEPSTSSPATPMAGGRKEIQWFGTAWLDMEKRLRSEVISKIEKSGNGSLRCLQWKENEDGMGKMHGYDVQVQISKTPGANSTGQTPQNSDVVPSSGVGGPSGRGVSGPGGMASMRRSTTRSARGGSMLRANTSFDSGASPQVSPGQVQLGPGSGRVARVVNQDSRDSLAVPGSTHTRGSQSSDGQVAAAGVNPYLASLDTEALENLVKTPKMVIEETVFSAVNDPITACETLYVRDPALSTHGLPWLSHLDHFLEVCIRELNKGVNPCLIVGAGESSHRFFAAVASLVWQLCIEHPELPPSEATTPVPPSGVGATRGAATPGAAANGGASTPTAEASATKSPVGSQRAPSYAGSGRGSPTTSVTESRYSSTIPEEESVVEVEASYASPLDCVWHLVRQLCGDEQEALNVEEDMEVLLSANEYQPLEVVCQSLTSAAYQAKDSEACSACVIEATKSVERYGWLTLLTLFLRRNAVSILESKEMNNTFTNFFLQHEAVIQPWLETGIELPVPPPLSAAPIGTNLTEKQMEMSFESKKEARRASLDATTAKIEPSDDAPKMDKPMRPIRTSAQIQRFRPTVSQRWKETDFVGSVI